MHVLTAGEVQKLLKIHSFPCVSLYMPTHHANKEVRQDSIRLKNLLRRAAEKLVARGISPQDAEAFLSPGLSLLDNSKFWENQSRGVAFFFSQGDLQYFHVALELKELVAVGERFHLMPLLPLLTQSDHFYILALGQKNLRLYDATMTSIREVELKNVPTSIDAGLHLDSSGKQRQYRVEAGAGAAQRPGSFHGQGVGTDSTQHKKDILRYFQMVDRALQDHVLVNGKPLLMLAGAEFELPIYREANSYPNLLEGGLAINPNGLDMKQLHEKAQDLVWPIIVQRQQAVIDQFHELTGTSRASESLEEILVAAHGGRVAVLLAPADIQRWGRYDARTASVEIHADHSPGDEDLLNIAAVQTLLHDGTVYVVRPEEMPDRKPAAAMFRY